MPSWKKTPPHTMPVTESITDDDSTRAELEEALTYLARYAAHQLHHVDCVPWRTAHERIDMLLDKWQATD